MIGYTHLEESTTIEDIMDELADFLEKKDID